MLCVFMDPLSLSLCSIQSPLTALNVLNMDQLARNAFELELN